MLGACHSAHSAHTGGRCAQPEKLATRLTARGSGPPHLDRNVSSHMGDDQLAAQQPRSVDRIEQLLIHVAPTTMQRKLYSTGGWKPLWSGGRRRSIHRLRLRRWVRCRAGEQPPHVPRSFFSQFSSRRGGSATTDVAATTCVAAAHLGKLGSHYGTLTSRYPSTDINNC